MRDKTTPDVVTIGVITFRRADRLAHLLEALDRLELGGMHVEVVVVDNDPESSARPTVSAWNGRQFSRVRYVHEPEPGIAAARNRVWSCVDTPWLAFIDDDETPEPQWLSALLATQRRTGADVVVGPVVAAADDLPQWFQDREHHAEGERVAIASTGNLLLRAALRDEFDGEPFDRHYGLTGGSDRVLSLDLRARGHEIVWSAEAIVHETVPAERLDPAWIRRRFVRYGTVVVRTDCRSASPVERAGRRALRLVEGLARTARALVHLRIVDGQSPQWGAALQQRGYGEGLVLGALGFHVVEYRRAGSWLRRSRAAT